MATIKIFDTSLRDGEQSPGFSMTLEQKLRVARALAELRVDIIEAGFPAASPGDFEAVRAVATEIQGPTIAALCRTVPRDIERSAAAIEPAASQRIHTFIATSPIHREQKLQMSRKQVIESAVAGVSLAKSFVDDVEFSAEDGIRTERDYLAEVLQAVIEAGATTVNIPDTVGYSTPQEMFELFSWLRETVPGMEGVTMSTHCHNDLGLAVANSLAAVQAGARQVECCINGIGERAGNAALEEIVMALKVRPALAGVQTNIATEHLFPTSKLVSEITGLNVQANKAIVGRNAFAHEAGIHQHGVLSDRRTYEIMEPEQIGLPTNSIVLGKHSGRAALRERLASLGYELDDQQLARAFDSFKKLCDKKKDIYDEDLYPLVAEDLSLEQIYKLIDVEFKGGSEAEPWARVFMEIQGVEKSAESTGDGPVNAAIEAVKQLTGKTVVRLQDYELSAVSGGSDAQGKVSLSINEDGVVSRGQGRHTDVVVASAEAFVNALNQQAYQLQLNARRSDPPEADA